MIKLDNNFEGTHSPQCLRNILKYVRIKRYNFDIQSFHRVAAGSYGDPILDKIETKFDKNYDCNENTELIAYYDLQESFGFNDKDWLRDLKKFVSKKIPSSFFKRVWIFDVTDNKILYVYPKLK